jgi:hypothetical protein
MTAPTNAASQPARRGGPNRAVYFVVALALAGAFAWTALRLLNVQFATGDFYPEYSTLRTDPLGAKLLYDSLAALPGITVTRGYVPLAFYEGSGSTVLMLGLRPAALDDAEFLTALEKAARRGNRVVAALTLPRNDDFDEDTGPAENTAPPRSGSKEKSPLETNWHVRLHTEKHRIHFDAGGGWTPMDPSPTPSAIERTFGKGAVALYAASGLFSNEAMVAGETFEAVTAAVGPNTSIYFDETHLGIGESGSVIGLARRYRLVGLVLGLALCAALAIWKHSSPFPPPQTATQQERTRGRTSFSGLATLLSRHVPPRELPTLCWQAWLKSNRNQLSPERVQRAEAIARNSSLNPLDAVREIQVAIRAKGAL